MCALGEKLRPGTWDAGRAGQRSGGAALTQGARPRWERVWRSLCPESGLRITTGLAFGEEEP